MSFERVQAVIDALDSASGETSRKVLEAGCGSISHLDFGTSPVITGIDISEKQLARNDSLTHKIHGDLQTADLGQGYDAAVCWDVLEHLDRPDLALENILGSIRPGGLVVIAAPNPWSPKGLLTKLTPYRFHVWVYRKAGKEWAGTGDRGPFPTPMRMSMAPGRIQRAARAAGFDVVHAEVRESNMQRNFRLRIGLTGRFWRITQRTIRILTLGYIDPAATDFILVLKAGG